MRRLMSHDTPSRCASRRSASRKTVASTRRPVVAAAVLPVRHIRALKSRAAANAPARAVATRPPRILASRRFSGHEPPRLHGSLRETASREPDVRRHAIGRPPSRACGRRSVGLRVHPRQTATAPGSGPGTTPPIRHGGPDHPVAQPIVGCRANDPRRRALRQHPRWRARLPREPSTDRDRRLAEGVVQAISIRLKRLHVDISEFPKGITTRGGFVSQRAQRSRR